ncbi:uncharacterized protein LOC133717275 isoform X2 [Rosa rugosa]|uniref:uncharacterized protein LOC133717275 isoform X2 n=1 Tax=Rosa rugosa TaxID=74645 RepID=UPI002B417F49|nr:uncharacterized protein LOC133717275 isoform X2 [Rosa rugosa]
MSPKKCLNLAKASDGEERRHRLVRHYCPLQKHKKHRCDGCVMKKEKKKKIRVSEKVKKTTKKLKLEEEEAKKSLYICFVEQREGGSVAIVVRTIKLSDLLSSDDEELQLRQVAYKAGEDVPDFVGCAVFGSQIIFAGGVSPSLGSGHRFPPLSCELWNRDVHAFEVHDNVFRKMDATLQTGKFFPMMVELGGKVYALSYKLIAEPPSFEVFDPKIGLWKGLPQPPFFQPRSPYDSHTSFFYAIAGTKMFVSHDKCPVFCFDVAHPDTEWRLVPTMCGGGPFPFMGKAFVLDLPEHHDDKKKIMFAYIHDTWRLGVYLFSLEEGQESIAQIGYLKLPWWPYELGSAAGCHFVHIGGQKACILITQFNLPYGEGPDYKPGTHKKRGVAIPFQFQVDITKVDRDEKNCFTLQFMTPRTFEFQTNPSTFPLPFTLCDLAGWD